MPTLQIRGEYVDEFICDAQDRTRNAHAKSVAAAFNGWKEMLQADQVTFESERISRHVCKKGMISIWPRRRQLIDHHTSESHLFAINYFFLKVGHACSPESEPRLCLCGAIEIGSSCAAKE